MAQQFFNIFCSAQIVLNKHINELINIPCVKFCRCSNLEEGTPMEHPTSLALGVNQITGKSVKMPLNIYEHLWHRSSLIFKIYHFSTEGIYLC